MIECKNINVQFDGKPVLNDLSFQTGQNEHLCISGISGKGKSTLLKLLQGYVIPDSGTIIINGISLEASNIKQIRNLITWIPQNINMPVDNGFELVKMMGEEERRTSILDFMHQLGLEPEMLDKDFNKISIGQKQRVVIAICFALGKPIILMDEPTAALDETSIQQLIDTVNKLKDTTVVSASHHPLWIKSADKTYAL
ncbi:ATP-binding cassette domain-containing protein [Saccharicrinis sp. FJH54]|uniref:ABC transporter ATP-binding protein n=1 Tax=Saccharicrinis sp. FJH54 TaxID=3344665 RepID=UPI0035D3E122